LRSAILHLILDPNEVNGELSPRGVRSEHDDDGLLEFLICSLFCAPALSNESTLDDPGVIMLMLGASELLLPLADNGACPGSR
jgi:hypothetical protein